jgi:predicted transglutaminase-like cysteine proteinase
MDAGDCEDFAMAKYFTLEKMGVDQQQLRLTYCRAATINKAHMVVSYFPSQQSSPLILDNLNMRIRPAVERGDLQPIYSFNGDELWLARKNREDVKAGSVENMRRWQEWRARTETRELPENLVVTTPP